jgi:HAMP domain-containing protein
MTAALTPVTPDARSAAPVLDIARPPIPPSHPTAGMAKRPVPGGAFPAPRFPSGVAAPPAAVLVVLLCAAIGIGVQRSDEAGLLGGPQGWPGVVPAVIVGGGAVLAWLVLRFLMIAPLKALRDDVEAVPVGRSVRRSRIRDIDQVAVALRASEPEHRHRSPRRALVSVTSVLVVVGVIATGVLGCACLTLVNAHRTEATQLVAETGRDADDAVDRLSRVLLDGLSTLQGMAGPQSTAAGDEQLEAVTTAALAVRPAFQTVSVVDGAGRVVASAGHTTRSTTAGPLVPGLIQVNTSGATPIIRAVATFDAQHWLVGEYDPRVLNKLLRATTDAHLRVLDSGGRTVLDNRGYEAFAEVHDAALLAAAAPAAVDSGTAADQVRNVAGSANTVAARRVGSAATTALGWTLLADREIAEGAFAHDPTGRAALAITSMSGGIVLALLLWMAVSIVVPLRSTAAHARALAVADATGALPAPLPVRRLDELGAVSARLNRMLDDIAAGRSSRPASTFVRGF